MHRCMVEFSEEDHFVSGNKIKNMVYDFIPDLSGCKLDTLETDWVEREIEKLAWVKKADIFKSYGRDKEGPKGILKIKITQYKPMFRVQNGETGYYVGFDKNRLPLSTLNTARVIVVTGNIDKELIEGDLYNFIDYIGNDRFWNAQIEQIHVTRKKELVLVPRVGSHLIEFGPICDLETKFQNLEAVYKHGFTEKEWRKYKSVSLKYKNQVICTLK